MQPGDNADAASIIDKPAVAHARSTTDGLPGGIQGTPRGNA
jgi:hypothetical protein